MTSRSKKINILLSGVFYLCAYLLIWDQDAWGLEIPLPKASWVKSGEAWELMIPLAGMLTPKQKRMIDGGFTTISEFTLLKPQPSEEADQSLTSILWNRNCTVKFNAWDETYEVVKLPSLEDTTRSDPSIVKSFTDYGTICLTAKISASPELIHITSQTGFIEGMLTVHQTSVEEGQRIKEWLVKQQSGLMQSLFKHMLGELVIHQTLKVKITLPTIPHETLQKVESKHDIAQPVLQGP